MTARDSLPGKLPKLTCERCRIELPALLMQRAPVGERGHQCSNRAACDRRIRIAEKAKVKT